VTFEHVIVMLVGFVALGVLVWVDIHSEERP
jgi:hypothetical protein